MTRKDLSWSVLGLLVLAHLVGLPDGTERAAADTIMLRDGRVLEGRLGQVSSLAENPAAINAEDAPIRLIVFVDDNLRRIFVPKAQITEVRPAAGEVLERILLRQRVASSGGRVASVGPIVRVDPDFDEHGRRIITMATNAGELNIIQGITEITPNWTKVEALAGKQSLIWDMRIATSSIRRETLKKILEKKIDPKKLDHRLKVVRLFLQSERYQDAQVELEGIIKDFPDEKQLEAEVRALRQLYARQIIDEIKVRRKAGQHRMVYATLEKFPREDVAGETLQQVKEMLEEYQGIQAQGVKVLKSIQEHVDAIQDSNLKQRCEKIHKEIVAELNVNTLDRMAAYLRLSADDQMSHEEKLALAISGWLLGSNQADTNLPVALSLVEVRDLVRSYLTEPVKLKRTAIIEQLQSQEGAAPRRIAQLITQMKPPFEPGEPHAGKAGYYQLQIPGFDKEPDVTYYVQLPPEYDPYRRYPAIVTLHGAATNAEQQIDWWAGGVDERGRRQGQATRQGYIVISVAWTTPGQTEYQYSAREHAAVLGCLRDACRRFSIDTDRVFLSGHSMGGDAAWDIAGAHPDLWAGAIPIVATADKYINLYWENAAQLPLYFVGGEMDGNRTVKNAMTLDRYLRKGYDVTVTEYLGRGHEHFYDDIQRIFEWMGHHERNFFPKKFTASTMRTWDNFFWWLELHDYPERGMVEPSDWPPKRGYRPVSVEGTINANNNIFVKSGADKVTIWLSPELIDFNRPVRVSVNGRVQNAGSPLFEPDLNVLLEDVRTRGERLHPFWAKVE